MNERTLPGQQLDKRHLISPIFRRSGISRCSSCCFSTCSPETIRNREIKILYSICLLRRVGVFCVLAIVVDEEGNCWIPALMIDEHHQGQGYGRQAMVKLIEHMRNEGCTRLMIGHRPGNRIAGLLYDSLGFQKVSEELCDGEVVRCLELNYK
ncbi:GNAT family N-acetyltransferase [Paenibacillus sp. FSL H7-0756]|uniref:GNAT family N-acetyltransferase n=1 Tax=Paenibacillus sp. FSL H7-0756 TaxID=2954738 RepID=UPI0030F5E7F1